MTYKLIIWALLVVTILIPTDSLKAQEYVDINESKLTIYPVNIPYAFLTGRLHTSVEMQLTHSSDLLVGLQFQLSDDPSIDIQYDLPNWMLDNGFEIQFRQNLVLDRTMYYTVYNYVGLFVESYFEQRDEYKGGRYGGNVLVPGSNSNRYNQTNYGFVNGIRVKISNKILVDVYVAYGIAKRKNSGHWISTDRQIRLRESWSESKSLPYIKTGLQFGFTIY